MSAVTLQALSPPLAQWLEEHGAEISISCAFGVFTVSFAWKKLHSYSDDRGEHSSSWRVARHDRDLPKALNLAWGAALEESSRKIPPAGA